MADEVNGYEEALKRISDYKSDPASKKLDLSGLSLLSIPAEISDLTSLTELDLSSNQLTEIGGLESLTNLSRLYLYNNQLTEIGGLESLTNLSRLYLYNNQLTEIGGLESLTSLSVLSLSSNQLTEIGGLESQTTLTELDLSNNAIGDLSSVAADHMEWLESLKNLKLRIHNNPFIEAYESIKSELYTTERDASHYEVFLSDLRNTIEAPTKPTSEAKKLRLPKKLLLLGNSDAGKSTLSDYLRDDSVLAQSGKESTEVLDIQKWELDEQQNYGFIYDFGGQDFYHGTYQMFLSAESIYAVVWDQNTNHNKASLPTKKRPNPYTNYHLRYWLGNIAYLKTELRQVRGLKLLSDPVIIIENKIDLRKDQPLVQQDLTSIKLADQFRVSLQDNEDDRRDDQGVDQKRRSLLKAYLIAQMLKLDAEEKFYPEKRKLIQAFLKRREAIERDEHKVIKIEDFEKKLFPKRRPKWWIDIGKEDADRQMSEMRLALRLLHNRGFLLFFHDDPNLSDTVFIDPGAVLEQIKEKLVQIGKSKEGRLSTEDVNGIDKKLLALALSQQVIFRNESSNDSQEAYIVPAYLKKSSTADLLYKFSTSRMKPVFSLKFDNFLPYGMMNRVICSFGREPHEKYFYKNEIIFTLDSNEHIRIKSDPVLLRIDVWATLSNDKDQNKYTEFIYRILMAAYYRIPTLDWQTYCIRFDFDELRSDEGRTPTDEKMYGSKRSHAFAKLEEQSILESRKKWDRMQDFECEFYLDKSIRTPSDLSISVDGEYFVKHKDIEAAFGPDANKTVVTGVQLTEDKSTSESDALPRYKEVQRHLFNAFMPNDIAPPKKVFISYAHDDTSFRQELQKYLINLERSGQIEIWQDGLIEPGEDWNAKILSKLRQADWIIMLISQSFIASNYIYEKELKLALERVTKGARVIPILISTCDWKNWKAYPDDVAKEIVKSTDEFKGSASNFNFLPLDAAGRPQAVKKWPDREDAWTQVTGALRELLS